MIVICAHFIRSFIQWIPAFAGMTEKDINLSLYRHPCEGRDPLYITVASAASNHLRLGLHLHYNPLMTHDEKFLVYEGMLREWQSRMNLVAPSTLDHIRERHISDSLQILPFLPADARIVDLGSGAGFPAVVLAIMDRDVVAIESITKKCNFLRAVKDALKLDNLTVINDRIESVLSRIMDNGQRTTVFTARAFASLEKILEMTWCVRRANYVLLKGERVVDEITAAQKYFKFEYKLIPSTTGPGFVLLVKNVRRI